MRFKRNPKIELVKDIPETVATWNGPGVIFRVQNGLGRLREAYGAKGDRGLHCLLFNDIPLIKYHGDAYMCPTCEKLISAGCGAGEIAPLMQRYRAAVGAFSSLRESLLALVPLLSLLSSGYYALADASLYPTDGDGSFFWTVTNTPRRNPATCPYYEDGNWAWETPRFLLPSQPPSHYNPDTAQQYRNRPNSRAVAYSLSSLCVLLDGHHKATAAALEGRLVKTLVILPVTGISFPSAGNEYRTKLSFSGEWMDATELGIEEKAARALITSQRLTDEETGRLFALSYKSFDSHHWPEEILATAKGYPDIRTLAYLEWGGDLSEERLDRILNGRECPDPDEMRYLCTALCVAGHPRFLDLAFRLGRDDAYAVIWPDLFKLIAGIQSEAVEDFFIEFLVHDDGIRPDVTRIASEYLDKRYSDRT